MNIVVIDATNGSVGRIASLAAKQALLGNHVMVVNCNEAVLTGGKRMVINEYKQAAHRGGHSLNGPFWVKRSPERLMKRTIRGMLSYKMGRGEAAFDKIRCYNQVPAEYKDAKKLTLPTTSTAPHTTLKALAGEL